MAYIGNSPANTGNYQLVDDIASSFNGTLVSFALASGGIAITPAKSGQILANINGVMQEPDDTGTDGFKVTGSNIVFSSAPANGDTFWAVYQGQNVDIGTPSDDVVDTAHIKDDAVTAAKLANSINTAIAANTAKTGITTSQASAITANTAKTGITSSQATAITAALPKAGGILTGDLDISDTGIGALTVGGTTNAYSAPVLFTVSDLGLDITDGTKHLASWANHGGSSHTGSAIGTRSNHDLALITNDTKAVFIDTTGAVTMPLQPAFLVLNSTQNNIAHSGSPITINFSNEIFDQNADFNPSNYTFTAPVTGKYQLNLVTYLNDIDISAAYIQTRIVTSNRHIQNIIDPNFTSDLGYYSESLSALFDMDAGDTAYVAIYQQNGSAQLDAQAVCYFSGYLAC